MKNISNNINQIALVANRSGSIYGEDLKQIKRGRNIRSSFGNGKNFRAGNCNVETVGTKGSPRIDTSGNSTEITLDGGESAELKYSG